jgi:squalene-associated FAD-dependent desaturase
VSKKSRIAIIGAGVSGLAAAIELAEHPNIELAIYEARREPGGRTRSYIDPATGDSLDNGQHLLASCYTSTLEYLARIGARHLIEEKETLEIQYRENSGSFRLRLPNLLSPADLAVGLIATNLLSAKSKLAAIRLGNAIRRGRLPDLSQSTVHQLLDYYHQPAEAVRKLWEPIVLATINAPIESASAVVFANVLRELFFGSSRGSALLFPKVGLSDLLISPAVKRLEMVDWKFGTPVRSVEPGHNSVTLVTDSDTATYDVVITSALSAMGVLEPEFSPIVNAYFWLDRKILDAPITGFLGTTLQWAFPRPTRFATQLLALTVSAANDLIGEAPDSIVARLWDELQSSIPGAARAMLLRSQVIKEKRATPLLSPSAQAKRPLTTSTGSRVFLAGDYVQNGLPATIEGAIRNGFAAARSVLRSIGEH